MARGVGRLTDAVTPHNNPRFSAASGSTVGVTVTVDMREACRKLGLAFEILSEEIKVRALVHALNRGCAPALTEVRRAVSKQTSIPYGRVMKHIRDDKAHPNRLEYRIKANDKAIPLHEFMVKGSLGKAPTVKVWGKQRTLKRAFVFKGKGITIVKRVANRVGGGRGKNGGGRKGSAGVKMLWGPIIPREMIRPGFLSLQTVQNIPARVQKQLPRELEQAVARAKAASGT